MNALERFNPFEVISKIHSQKYKTAIIAFVLVATGFLLNLLLNISWAKYLTLFGLLVYIFILIIFKFNKIIPEITAGEIVSPINGKIISISDNEIIIEKGIFSPAEFRIASEDPLFSLTCIKGKAFIYYEDQVIAGTLAGIVPGFATIKITIPPKYKIIVDSKIKCKSGITIIAKQLLNT